MPAPARIWPSCSGHRGSAGRPFRALPVCFNSMAKKIWSGWIYVARLVVDRSHDNRKNHRHAHEDKLSGRQIFCTCKLCYRMTHLRYLHLSLCLDHSLTSRDSSSRRSCMTNVPTAVIFTSAVQEKILKKENPRKTLKFSGGSRECISRLAQQSGAKYASPDRFHFMPCFAFADFTGLLPAFFFSGN